MSALIEATLRKEKETGLIVLGPIGLLGGVWVESRLMTTGS